MESKTPEEFSLKRCYRTSLMEMISSCLHGAKRMDYENPDGTVITVYWVKDLLRVDIKGTENWKW